MADNRMNNLTEEAFRNEDYTQFLQYARNTACGFVKDCNLKLVDRERVVCDTIERSFYYVQRDYEKGLYRVEGEFRRFYWYRIKKAFYEVLKLLREEQNEVAFDERIGKYLEGSAGHKMFRDYDDINDLSYPEPDDMTDGEENENDEKKVCKCTSKESNIDVCLYSPSHEKDLLLDDNWKTKLEYVQKIKNLVSKMDDMHKRLFDIRFGFNMSQEDLDTIDDIQKRSHAKEYYVRMAANEFGIAESTARKRIHDMLDYIKKSLVRSGDMTSYKPRTSLPDLLEFNVVDTKKVDIDKLNLEIDKFSDRDCLDIFIEMMS